MNHEEAEKLVTRFVVAIIRGTPLSEIAEARKELIAALATGEQETPRAKVLARYQIMNELSYVHNPGDETQGERIIASHERLRELAGMMYEHHTKEVSYMSDADWQDLADAIDPKYRV